MADNYDIYSALTGGAPTDAQRQAALAAALRNQSQMGRIYQLSGDRVIGPLGEQMSQEALHSGEQVSAERERQANLEMMMAYRAAQERNMEQRVAATVRGQDVGSQTKKDVANIQGATARDVAAVKERTAVETHPAGGVKLKPIPESTRKEIENTESSLAGVDQALQGYKPGFGGTGRGAVNWLAANVPMATTDAQKAAQNWWANYGRQFTLPELKATIGLRHNQYMQGVFESYHLNPNMSDDQITKNLGQIHSQVIGRIERNIKGLRDQGYDVSGYERYLPAGDQAPVRGAPPTPGVQPSATNPQAAQATRNASADQYLKRSTSTSVPAYMVPGSGAPGAQPLVRPTPPMPQGNLLQGITGGYGSQ